MKIHSFSEDTIIELGGGFDLTPESSRDTGIIFQRGTERNLFFGWDESIDNFVLGETNSESTSETIQITSYSFILILKRKILYCQKLSVSQSINFMTKKYLNVLSMM